MSSLEAVRETVDAILPQALTFGTTGGKVDQVKAFAEVREIAMLLLARNPNAILALIEAVRNRTLEAVLKEFDLVTQLKQALDDLDTGLATTEIKTTAPLTDALGAITGLEADAASGFVEPEVLNKVTSAIDSFLENQLAPNVRDGVGSEIVTLSEAINQARLLIEAIPTAHTETLSRVNQLEKVFSEFTAAEIRTIVGETITRKTKDRMQLIVSTADSFPSATAAISGDVATQLITLKRILSSFFDPFDPLSDRLVGDGSNTNRVDAVGTGTPATLDATTIVRPLVLIESGSSVVDITANGTLVSLDLLTFDVESIPATLFTSETGLFAITAGVNDKLVFTIDGTLHTITLTAGGSVPRSTIVSDINGVVTGVASEVDINGVTIIQIQSTTNGRNSHILVGLDGVSPANDTIGVQADSLEAGTDPTLADVAQTLNENQVEYEAEAIDQASTTLFSLSGDSIVFSVLTDASEDFIAGGVEPGDVLEITSGTNAGISIPIFIVTTTQLFAQGLQDDSASMTYEVIKLEQVLRITSEKDDTTSALVIGSGNANGSLGFSGSETAKGTVPFIRFEDTSVVGKILDPKLNDILAGDTVTIAATPFTVVSFPIIGSDFALEITPEIVNDTSDAFFTVESSGAISFKAFIDDPIDTSKPLPNFIRTDLTANGFDKDLSKLEDAIAVAINSPTDPVKVGTAVTLAGSLLTILDNITGLQSILALYDASTVPSFDRLLDILAEHNFDRFLDLLIDGRIQEMLTVTSEDFSFAANLEVAVGAVSRDILNG